MWMLEDVQDCNGVRGRNREDTARAASTSTLADGDDGETGLLWLDASLEGLERGLQSAR